MRTSCNALSSSGEESIIEYGPGIVSKLRCKYQSLGVRLNSHRPSLRRSNSFENCLDLITIPTTRPSSETRMKIPTPVIPGVKDQKKLIYEKMTLNIRPIYVSAVKNSSTINQTRGRLDGPNEMIRHNRMRRARSVDALHHVEYTPQEEEILEKFKTVVMPKEEVVIIEMSKPRLNIGCLEGNEKPSTENHHYAISNRLTSIEDELPPHDIVRETARIFERNPGIHWKKVGQALRVCKSSSVSPPSSVCSSPIPSSTSVTAEKKIQVVSAQPNRLSISHNEMESDMRKSQNNKLGSKSEPGIPIKNSTPIKQVGVIRPTMNGVGVGGGTKVTHNSSVPPIPARLSARPAGPNRAFQFVMPRKPPLSPKPLEVIKKTLGPFPRGVKMSEKSQRSEHTIKNSESQTVRLTSPVSQPFKFESSLANQESSTIESSASSYLCMDNPGILTNLDLVVSTIKEQDSQLEIIASVPITNTAEVPKKLKENMESECNLVESTHESQNTVSKQPYNDTPSSISKTGNPSSGKETVREGDALKNKNNHIVRPEIKEEKSVPIVSQLRSYQKQKSQQPTGGTMVFNFTSRSKVPDYIEDDGIRRTNLNGTLMDESSDEVLDGYTNDRIDPKLIDFIGANVIINGKSSLQKNPKSQKMNIKFNEEGTTTFEYPSESYILTGEVTTPCNNNLVGQQMSSAMNLSGGNALSNYTPSKVSTNPYQLGHYMEDVTDAKSKRKFPSEFKNIRTTEESSVEGMEDYLKPDTGTTTWSNELGAADILF